MNDRLKFRVWDKKHNEYIPSSMISTLLYFGHRDEFHIEFECFSTFADSLIIEQCTGLSDKNGNLIYEGDLIKDRGEIKYQIMWKNAQFVAVAAKEFDYMPDNLLNQKWLDTWKIEIIGNINRQGEQKDVK